MKPFRTAVCALLFVTPLAPIRSQEPATAPSIAFGVIAGVSSTGLAGKEAAPDLARITGLLAGFSFVAPLMIPRVDAEVDALYSAKGFRSPGAQSSSVKLMIGYFEVPVLIRLNLAPSARVRPFIAAGPSIGYRARCKGESRLGNTTRNLDCLFDTVVEFNRIDVSGVIGAGVVVPAGSALFTVGTRFTRGFSNVFADQNGNHNEAVSLYVGLSKAR